MKRHVVLVGLPGAGKTTVGKLVAAQLGTPFVDLDEAVERRSGRTIAQLFAEAGEAHFRALERAEMERALGAEPGVVAAGGGWAAQPGNLEAVAGRGLVLYLRVAPEVAARRAGPTAERRPLLSGAAEREREERMRELLALREAFYQRSDATVAAHASSAEAVASEVIRLARSRAGWY